MALHVDFETQSASNLKVEGSYLYAKNETTSVLCVGVALNGEKPKVLKPESFRRYLKSIRFNESTEVKAHNAAFELDIWNHCGRKRYGWPQLTIEQTDCTMVRAYAMGLPGGLDDCSAALGIRCGKDMAGHRVMLKLSRPKPKPLQYGIVEFYTPEEVPEDFKALYRYCGHDVFLERDIDSLVLPLSPSEKELWCVDYAINQRGLRIDVEAAVGAKNFADAEKESFDRAIRTVTEGAVDTCNQRDAIIRYLKNEHSIQLRDLSAPTVSAFLSRKSLPLKARQVALLRQRASKTSTSKIGAMLTAQLGDGRLRGLFQFHAATTGRWGGRRLQPQNLSRGELSQEQVSRAIELLRSFA